MREREVQINSQSDVTDGRETDSIGTSLVSIAGSICLQQFSLHRFTLRARSNVFLTPIASELHFILRSAVRIPLSLSLFIASHQLWGTAQLPL